MKCNELVEIKFGKINKYWLQYLASGPVKSLPFSWPGLVTGCVVSILKSCSASASLPQPEDHRETWQISGRQHDYCTIVMSSNPRKGKLTRKVFKRDPIKHLWKTHSDSLVDEWVFAELTLHRASCQVLWPFSSLPLPHTHTLITPVWNLPHS